VLSGSHGHVLSVLNVSVFPRPFEIHRALRFYEPANSLVKRQIQLYGSGESDPRHTLKINTSKFVHCVECGAQNRVVVDWMTGYGTEEGYSESAMLTISFRYRCDGYPSIGNFYLLLFNDEYRAELFEVWEVIVYSCQQISVNSTVGNAAAIDLVVRGSMPNDADAKSSYALTRNRRAKGYALPSSEQAITFSPSTPFPLISGAFNKVTAHVVSASVGSRYDLNLSRCLICRRTRLNIVDVDSRELLASWVVSCTATPPLVMKSYEVVFDVQGSNEAVLHKKIIFKNLWDNARAFKLVSSNPAVMQPR
jgi:hypothetical protein